MKVGRRDIKYSLIKGPPGPLLDKLSFPVVYVQILTTLHF